MPTNILVAGGAGFIGSHMVKCLLQAGYTPVVLDNLSNGHREAVIDAEIVIGDIANISLLDQLFARYQFSAVMHFASFIQVNESVIDPAKYYQNNISATLTLLQTMLKWQIKNFIFSSSAAVYGEPQYTPIDEKHPVLPVNPYGYTKWVVEQILKDFNFAYDLRYIALRYFNAAGADPEGQIGEWHEPETHLIPRILHAVHSKQKVMIYGCDYPTADGTCVRDYVHVMDLCSAHLSALQALFAGKSAGIYNLGTGQDYSVKQVIAAVQQLTQQPIWVEEAGRRSGDSAILVADPSLAMRELNWKPKFSDLETIIKHAINGLSAFELNNII